MRTEVSPTRVLMSLPTRSKCYPRKQMVVRRWTREAAEVEPLVRGFLACIQDHHVESNALQQNMARKIIVVV